MSFENRYILSNSSNFVVEISVISLSLFSLFIFLIFFPMARRISKLNRHISSLNIEISNHQEQLKEAVEKAREDSKKRHRATLKGDISEIIAPWALEGVNSVKELRFLGSPIDFIGFNGLDIDGEINIKFIEIKTGKSRRLTPNEKRIKEAVEAKRVAWQTIEIKSLPEAVEK